MTENSSPLPCFKSYWNVQRLILKGTSKKFWTSIVSEVLNGVLATVQQQGCQERKERILWKCWGRKGLLTSSWFSLKLTLPVNWHQVEFLEVWWSGGSKLSQSKTSNLRRFNLMHIRAWKQSLMIQRQPRAFGNLLLFKILGKYINDPIIMSSAEHTFLLMGMWKEAFIQD